MFCVYYFSETISKYGFSNYIASALLLIYFTEFSNKYFVPHYFKYFAQDQKFQICKRQRDKTELPKLS